MATLCPGLAWGGGDSAKFAIWVHTLHLGYGLCDHPLYIVAAKLFSSCLPSNLSLTYKLNIFSAVCASLTLTILCRLASISTDSLTAGITAASAFMVSHTFWMHAVLTEVYTLHTLLLTAMLYALCRWHKSPHDRWLLAASFLFGLGISNHALIVLCLPGCVFFVAGQWVRRKRTLSVRLLLLISFWCLFGASLIEALVLKECFHHGSLEQCKTVFASIFGSGVITELRPSISKTFLTIGYLGYQFPIIGIILGVIGIHSMVFKLRDAYPLMLVTLLGIYILFPICYKVRDHYQFAISAYLCFALCIAFGIKALYQRFMSSPVGPLLSPWILICSIVMLPCFVYYGTAAVCDRWNIDIAQARSIPYRNNNWYFLWPPKNGDNSASRYAQETLAIVESNALIVGDYTPIMVLRYYQLVEGKRPDVMTAIGMVGEQLRIIRENLCSRPVYVATIETKPSLIGTNMYLSYQHLDDFMITAAPPVFKISLKTNSSF
ncbi:MAG: DUF2723 domain-containing protein [Desulfobacterota bacterium]|nr:DUF2723 domain-containing protein [Thermodesulfobacteriota bacterium]